MTDRSLDITRPRLSQQPPVQVLSHFIVRADPLPKERPRLGKGGRVYTPAKTVGFEETVLWAYRLAGGKKATDPEVRVGMSLVLLQKGYARRDIDNLQKAIQDALNGWGFVDDWQIDETVVQRRMGAGAQALAEVMIYVLD